MNRQTTAGIILAAILVGGFMSIEIIRRCTPANHSGGDAAMMARAVLTLITGVVLVLIGLLMRFLWRKVPRPLASCLIGIGLLDLLFVAIAAVFVPGSAGLFEPLVEWLTRSV